MKILILEDDKAQCVALERMINEKYKYSTIATCLTIAQAASATDEYNFDILLVDIEIGGENSIDFIEELMIEQPEICGKVIYLTAHKKYALDAINRTHCFGYIEKPYDQQALTNAIDKCIASKKKDRSKIDFFDFKIRGDIHFVNKTHILFFEVQNKKPILHTQNEVFFLPRTTVKQLMEKLNDTSKSNFIRCRRDNIVNLNQIAHIRRQGSLNYVVLNNGIKVPIGEKFKDDLFDKLRI